MRVGESVSDWVTANQLLECIGVLVGVIFYLNFLVHLKSLVTDSPTKRLASLSAY